MSRAPVLASVAEFAARWGEWMFAMSWQVALLVALLLAVCYALRRQSANLRHALWLLVLVRLVIPPTFTLPTGWGWWLLPRQTATTEEGSSAPSAAELSDRAAVGASEMSAGTQSEDHKKNSPQVGRTGDLLAQHNSKTPSASESPSKSHSNPSASDEQEPSVVVTAPSGESSWASYAFLGWLGVSGTLLGLLGAGTLKVWKWVYDAEPIDDAQLYLLLEDCRRVVGLPQYIELRNSDACVTPVVVGFFRPVILLPRAVLSKLTALELRAVLIHELQHVARCDALVNLFQGVLQSLYFFHPLVWWSNHHIRQLREEACDELTVAALDGERKTYGQALVKVTEIFGYASPPLALGVMESKSPAIRRLRRILDPAVSGDGRLGWRGAAVCLLAGLLLLPAGGAPATDHPDNGRPVVAQAPADTESRHAESEASDRNQVAVTPQSALQRPVASEANPGRSQSAERQTAEAGNSPVGLKAIPPPRYRWSVGEELCYRVKIEVDLGDEIETLEGQPAFRVRRVDNGVAELVFNGQLMGVTRLKDPANFRMLRPPFRHAFPRPMGFRNGFDRREHVLILDERAAVYSISGESPLPHCLGNLSQLLFVTLPEGARTEWEESSDVSVTLPPAEDPHFPPSAWSHFRGQDEGERLQARQVSRYLFKQGEKDSLVVRKTVELTTAQATNGVPRASLSTDLQTTLDREKGIATSIIGKMELVLNEQNTTRRIPMTLSAQLLSAEDLARLRQAQAEADRKAQEKHPIDDATLDDVLADFDNPDHFAVQRATDRLEKSLPNARRPEVARALEGLLLHKNGFVRQKAAAALVIWGDADSLSALYEALDDDHFTVVWSALEALGHLGNAESADRVVQLYRGNKYRIQASKCLAQMGSVAEPAVLELLEDRDWSVRLQGCRLLESIGGEPSVAPLQHLSHRDEVGLVQNAALQALKTIRERKPQ